MRRLGIILLCQMLLWAIVGQLNHLLTDLRVYLFAAVLYVAPTSLWHSWRAGLAAGILGGLLCDANSPVAFGTHAMLFAAAHVAIFQLRERLPRGEVVGQVVVAVLVNLGLFIAFALTQMGDSPAPGAVWSRLAVDLLVSQLFVALVTPWFFALQARALVLAGAGRENFA